MGAKGGYGKEEMESYQGEFGRLVLVPLPALASFSQFSYPYRKGKLSRGISAGVSLLHCEMRGRFPWLNSVTLLLPSLRGMSIRLLK